MDDSGYPPPSISRSGRWKIIGGAKHGFIPYQRRLFEALCLLGVWSPNWWMPKVNRGPQLLASESDPATQCADGGFAVAKGGLL